MEDGSKTPVGSTVGGPVGGASNPAVKQPMIYICGECHAENEIRQRDPIRWDIIDVRKYIALQGFPYNT